ncbi:hypothetical protein BLNAU_20547 [Blattamonas nauphoetae]|uniref:Uncharacterized protein n=1 Tax=Blattamonas nauphoetae TaxID=2049346 RepID=A0ABQ9WYE6_9EUKA|nr:hypothetical protein BLNAU_20547 [Blattamonas nauphoetae]
MTFSSQATQAQKRPPSLFYDASPSSTVTKSTQKQPSTTPLPASMCITIVDDEQACFKQYHLIRVSVFEPAQQFITFMFHIPTNSLWMKENKISLSISSVVCTTTSKTWNSDQKHAADTVSELVKWEVQTMVAMENEEHLMIVCLTLLYRTWEWNRDKPKRQKRREVLLREEGWDNGFELRVVGMDVDTSQDMRDCWMDFGVERALNAD